MKGYGGMITYVDLSSRRIWDEPTDETFARTYLGGNGFAAKILYDRVPKGADPLGPDNALILCSGPLNGTLAHGSGRTGIVTKSPLTGYFIDSYFGGDFGSKLKQSGRDAVVIIGKASEAVVLFLDDARASLVPAEEMWGLTTREVQDRLFERLGRDISTVCCGPAGERLVPIACSIGGRRAAGRGGTGAVMGSKNLKAVSVRGTRDIEVADIRGLMDYYSRTKERFTGLKALAEVGTPYLVGVVNEIGGLGTRNWQEERFTGAERISGERLLERHFVRNWACFACAMGGCTRVVRSLRSSTIMTEGPEYETLFALGSNCEVDELDVIIEADRLCDDYGIDTISLGGSIAFLMECFQRGLISTADTDGIDFSFGKGDTILSCVHLVGRREGVGDLLGKGVKAISEIIGRGSEGFACHIRGLEPPGHSARALKSMGLGYAVSPRGGSHHDTRPGPEYRMDRDKRASTEGKARLAYDTSNWTAIGDSLIVCHFMEGVHGASLGQPHVDLVNMATGWDLSLEELERISCRIHTLERCFNCRERLRRKDDTLPARFMKEAISGGASDGLRTAPEELETMIDQYYAMRGWDSEGIPKKETLEELGLSLAQGF